MCSKNRDEVRVGELSFDYRKGPSFSSTLLEHIYKSIDGDDGEESVMWKKKDKVDVAAVQRANLLEKWMMDKKKKPPVASHPPIEKKLYYIDNDPLFFSTGSNSSDSNSSLFSDHDPVPVVLPTTKTRSSCFLPPKPIRTRENKNTVSKTEHDENDDVPASTKSRALKLYSHLKKMKQPISPGVKLTTFINSILSKSNTKKHSNRGSTTASAAVRPTCSSASSFTRTCLTTPTTTMPSSTNSTKPTSVKLAPVNVKIKTKDQDLHLPPQVLNRAPNSKPTSKISVGRVSEDARSDCSDDLFELDHLKLSNINGGDLPVFETTRINTNHKTRVLVLKHLDRL